MKSIRYLGLLAALTATILQTTYGMENPQQEQPEEYIDLKKVFLDVADTLTDNKIETRKVLKAINDSLNFQTLSVLIDTDSKALERYVNFGQIQRITSDIISENEICEKKIIDIFKLDQISNFIGCSEKDLKEYINLEKLVQLILDLTKEKEVTKQELLDTIDFKKIKDNLSAHKSNLKDYVNFENGIDRLVGALTDQNNNENNNDKVSINTILKIINQSMNYKKFLELTGFNGDTLEPYIDFNNIKAVIDEMIDKKPFTGGHIVRIIKAEAIAAIIGCEPKDLEEYINLEGLACLIFDRCLGKKITILDIERIRKAISFEKIEEDFGVCPKLMEQILDAYVLDECQQTQTENIKKAQALTERTRNLITRNLSNSWIYGIQGATAMAAILLLPYFTSKALCPDCIDFMEAQRFLTGTLALISTYGLYQVYKLLKEPALLKNIKLNTGLARLGQKLSNNPEHFVPLINTGAKEDIFQEFKKSLNIGQKKMLGADTIAKAESYPVLLIYAPAFINSLNSAQEALLFNIENFGKSITKEQNLLLPKPRNILLFKANTNAALLLDKEDFIKSLDDGQLLFLSKVIEIQNQENIKLLEENHEVQTPINQ